MKTDHLSNLVTVKRETTTRNEHTFEAIYFLHLDFDGLIHAARCDVCVNQEGDPSHFWGSSQTATREISPSSSVGEDEDDNASDLPPVRGNHSEDIANFRNQGFDVDDDNEPAVENIPTGEEPTTNNGSLKEGQSWEWDGINRRSIVKPEEEGHTYENSLSPIGAAYSEVILHFLPLTFLAETVLTNTNDASMAIGEPELVWGEFLCFLGILALMATVSGCKRDDFWCVNRAFDQRENHCPIISILICQKMI
jgi:hypothetical protein